MSSLRILMVADLERNPNAGAAGAEIQLGEALTAQGHEVVQLWRTDLPHRIRHGNLHQLIEQPLAYRAAIRRAIATHGEFDVYHVNQPAGWLAAREHQQHRRSGVFVHRSHGYEPHVEAVLQVWRPKYEVEQRPPWRRLTSAVLQRVLRGQSRGIERFAEAHLVGSTRCAEFLCARGVSAERVVVMPLPPATEFNETPAPPMSEVRARRLLYVGQHAFVKAPMLVAATLNRVMMDRPDVEATWVCEEGAHGAVRAAIAPGILNRVSIVRWMKHSELREIFDSHGIFLFPSFFEGFGRAFIEAMSRGLCVVASGQGGARDVIRSGLDGVLTPVGELEPIVAGVRGLLMDFNAAAAMSEEAARTARRYSWGSTAAAVAGFLGARRREKARA